jgi:hypothetical protein
MLDVVSTIRARVLAIAMIMVVSALPLAAQLAPCASACNQLSREVYKATGNDDLADQVFDECFQEQCVG